MTLTAHTNVKKIARIYLVRHGETQENRDGIIQGQQDTRLNEKGKEQARCLGEALKDVVFHAAFSSDLARAVETADAVLKHHPDLQVVKQKELRERFMGHLEGRRARAKLVAIADEEMETSGAFSQRAVSWWNRTILAPLSKDAPGPVTILVVSHGGVITTLVRDLIGSRKLRCGDDVVIWKCFNSSVSIVDIWENKKGTLVVYGDVSHLAQSDAALDANSDFVGRG